MEKSTKIVIWILVALLVLALFGCAVVGTFLLVSAKVASEKADLRSELTEARKKADDYWKTIQELEAKLAGNTADAVEKVPDDIPLHSDFEWTPPLKSEIFRPNDPDFDRVVFSSRQKLGGAMPYTDWYKQKLAEKGWTNIVRIGGSTNLHAQKGSRRIYILWEAYSVFEDKSGAGLDSSGGYFSIYYKR